MFFLLLFNKRSKRSGLAACLSDIDYICKVLKLIFNGNFYRLGRDGMERRLVCVESVCEPCFCLARARK